MLNVHPACEILHPSKMIAWLYTKIVIDGVHCSEFNDKSLWNGERAKKKKALLLNDKK